MERKLKELEKRLAEITSEWNPYYDEEKLSNMEQQVDIIKDITDIEDISEEYFEDFYESQDYLKYYYDKINRIENNREISTHERVGRIQYISVNEIPPREYYVEKSFNHIKKEFPSPS